MVPSYRHLLLLPLNQPHAKRSHLSATFLGSRICSVINIIALSSTISINAFLASPSLCPAPSTGLTQYAPNNVAKTATNSTCANFWPGQTRGPRAHGMKLPWGGEMKVWRDGRSPLLEGTNQRSGRQLRLSGPHVLGSVCSACTLMFTAVDGGILISFPPGPCSVWVS